MASDITKECTSSIYVAMFEGKLSFQKGILIYLYFGCFWMIFFGLILFDEKWLDLCFYRRSKIA
jgi:hypothetical protein